MRKSQITFAISWVILGLISVFIVIYFSLNYYITHNLNTYIKHKFSEATDFKYSITFDDVSINILSETISANNIIVLKRDENKDSSMQIDFKSKKIIISGVDLYDYFTKKKLALNKIEFDSSEIFFYLKPTERISNQSKIYKKNNQTKKHFPKVSINTISLVNFNTSIFRTVKDKKPFFQSYSNYLLVKDIILNSHTNNKDSFLTIKDADLVLNNIKYNFIDSLYTLYVKKTHASFSKKYLSIDSLKLTPNYSKKEFATKAKFQVSRTEIYTTMINVYNLNYNELINKKNINANKIKIKGCIMNIYRDNTKPLEHKKKPSFQAIIKSIPVLCTLDTIELKNGKLNFEALHPKAKTTGKISINKINLLIYGIKNDSTNFTEKQSVTAKLDGCFLNKAKFTESYIFPLNNNNTELFYCTGSISSTPLSTFNSMIIPAKHLLFKSGQLDTVSFSFKAQENYSTGLMTLKYHNLEIEVLNKNQTKNGLKAIVSSFILNTFKIEKSNPEKNKKARIVKLYVKHNPYRYFLFYSMQSILSGIEPTINK